MQDLGEDQRRAVSILNVGGVDHGVNQVTLGVGEDVAFAALDLLASIIAPRTAAFRGFYALTVDHTGARRSLATLRLARDHQQRMIDREPQAVVAPQIEPAPDR